MSDQDRTSPYNIYTVSRKRMMRTGKYLLRDYQLIQLQILGTNVIRIVWKSPSPAEKRRKKKLVIANPPKSQICEIVILKTFYATLPAT